MNCHSKVGSIIAFAFLIHACIDRTHSEAAIIINASGNPDTPVDAIIGIGGPSFDFWSVAATGNSMTLFNGSTVSPELATWGLFSVDGGDVSATSVSMTEIVGRTLAFPGDSISMRWQSTRLSDNRGFWTARDPNDFDRRSLSRGVAFLNASGLELFRFSQNDAFAPQFILTDSSVSAPFLGDLPEFNFTVGISDTLGFYRFDVNGQNYLREFAPGSPEIDRIVLFNTIDVEIGGSVAHSELRIGNIWSRRWQYLNQI